MLRVGLNEAGKFEYFASCPRLQAQHRVTAILCNVAQSRYHLIDRRLFRLQKLNQL